MPRKLWHRVDVLLPEHPKVLNAATLLEVDTDLVVGKLLRIWLWTHVHALETGDITPWVSLQHAPKLFNIDARLTKTRQEIAQKWLSTFISCGQKDCEGLLDRDESGRVFVHGWAEYIGEESARKSSNLNRQRKFREKQKQVKSVDKTEDRNALRNTNVTPQSSSRVEYSKSNTTTTEQEALRVTAEKQEQPPKDRPLDWMEVILTEWESVTGVNPGGCDERVVNRIGPAWHEFHQKRGEPALRQVVRFYLETTDAKYITFKSFIDGGLSKAPRALEVEGWLEGVEESESKAETESAPPAPVSADMAALWKQIAPQLREAIGDEDYGTWFHGVYLLRVNGSAYTLSVPGEYRRNVIQKGFESHLRIIVSTLHKIEPVESVEIKYQITGHIGGTEQCLTA